jgi:allantoin racemase
MRIKIINPNTTELMTAGIHETALRVARPGTEIVTVNPLTGPSSIEGYFDGALSVIGVMEEVLRSAKGEKVDAFILACFGDPGLEALRELTDIPVVGIAEAAIFLSCFLAPKFSVITVIPRVVVPMEQIVRKYGVSERLASVRATKLSVLEFLEDLEGGKRALMQEGRLAVEEDGAEVLLLGCAGMAGLDGEMEKEVGVPVIDGVAAAVKIAEGLVDLNKRTSKVRTYARPEKKPISGFPPIFCE